uniref:Uncharacterized protein n=1 Tax=Anguilla anguilla TaxID=7936 RepID=A0A0E9Q3B9_ANGAN
MFLSKVIYNKYIPKVTGTTTEHRSNKVQFS